MSGYIKSLKALCQSSNLPAISYFMEATEMTNSKYLIEPKTKLHNILKTDNSFHEHLKYTFFGYNNLQKPQNQPQLHIRQQVIYHTNELQFLTHSTVFIH